MGFGLGHYGFVFFSRGFLFCVVFVYVLSFVFFLLFVFSLFLLVISDFLGFLFVLFDFITRTRIIHLVFICFHFVLFRLA